MIKKIEWVWEELDKHTSRAKVIGGWIVRSEYVLPKEKLCCTSSIFIPDSNHEWTIKAPFDPSNAGTTHKPKVNPEDFAASK